MTDVIPGLVETLKTMTTEANALGARIQAADAGKGPDQVSKFVDTSDDPRCVKFREQREKLEAKIEELRSTLVTELGDDVFAEVTVTDEDRANHAEMVDKARSLRKVLVDSLGATAEQLSEAGVPELARKRSASGNRGNRAGTRLYSFSSMTVDGEEVFEDTEKGRVQNFTTLARWFAKNTEEEVTAKSLREATVAAAGTEELTDVSEVKFAVGKHDVSVYPTSRKRA